MVLFVLVPFFACKKDDPDPAPCSGGDLEMTLNSEQVTAISFNNTLLMGGSTGRRMDIRATDADGRQLTITFTDLFTNSGNCVSTNEYIPFDDITTGTENTFLFTITQDGVSESFIDGSLDITSCDANARKVSGTFSFSFGDTDVTNGTFTDVCYTII